MTDNNQPSEASAPGGTAATGASDAGCDGTGSRPMAHCCYIDRDRAACPVGAEWEIWDGVQPYFDHYLHACTEHVGALLTDLPEHRVYRIDPLWLDVPRHSAPGPSRLPLPPATAIAKAQP
jgi:hypothetical protein